jgi:hypothetical protein
VLGAKSGECGGGGGWIQPSSNFLSYCSTELGGRERCHVEEAVGPKFRLVLRTSLGDLALFRTSGFIRTNKMPHFPYLWVFGRPFRLCASKTLDFLAASAACA